MDYVLPAIISGIYLAIVSTLSWKWYVRMFGREEAIIRCIIGGLICWVFFTYLGHELIQHWGDIVNNPYNPAVLIFFYNGLVWMLVLLPVFSYVITQGGDLDLSGWAVIVFMFCYLVVTLVIWGVWEVVPIMISFALNNPVVGFFIALMMFGLLVAVLASVFRWLRHKQK